jgi:hypothetical protein
MRPSAAMTFCGAAPFSGEAGSTTAVRMSLSRNEFDATKTAEPTLAIVRDPECDGALGKVLSPKENRTRCSGRPSASAATRVIDV